MSADFSLSPLIAATAHWLTRAYPADGGALQRGLAEAQARQAVTVAAWLCYPTELDAQLVALTGPGGSNRLDRIAGTDAAAPSGHGAGGGVGASARKPVTATRGAPGWTRSWPAGRHAC